VKQRPTPPSRGRPPAASHAYGKRSQDVLGGAVATPIAGLSNLGPKSQQMLAACGIESVAQLRQLGSVAAYAKVKAANKSASLNLLWALEGALSGLPWQEVARIHRTSLLLSLEERLQMAASPSIEQTSSGRLRVPAATAHVKR